MQTYVSHKEVQAAKITAIHHITGNKVSFKFQFAETITVERVQLEHKPIPMVGWYYIIYPDGYFSFSPADQFEKGYTHKI